MTEQENTRYTQRMQWRWREYVQHNEGDSDWGPWDDWEDIPARDSLTFEGTWEFETRLTYADAVPPTIVSATHGAGKNPVPPTAPVGRYWSGTVKACDVTSPHGTHAWRSGDDGFLGGGEDFLCPGIRVDGPETREEWESRRYLGHYGYRGPWPLTPGQEVSAQDVAALYLAASIGRLRSQP